MNPFQTPGAFSWQELITSDPAAAEKFYSELFGWELEPMAMGMPYTVVKTAGEAIGGIMGKPPTAPEGMPSMWGGYVTVANVDATAQKAVSLGATICHGPLDVPGVGRMYTLQDPQGAVLSIIQYEMKESAG